MNMHITPSTQATPMRSRWLRALGWAAAIGVCALVFAMYTVPDFMVMVADKVWSCF
jgi:hypothetical protein